MKKLMNILLAALFVILLCLEALGILSALLFQTTQVLY